MSHAFFMIKTLIVGIFATAALAGAEIHQLDFMEDDADLKVKEWLGGNAERPTREK